MIWRLKRLIKQFFNRIFRPHPPMDIDPYAEVPVRTKRGPGDRSSAVAVLEPDDE